jgi:hypothetical protein
VTNTVTVVYDASGTDYTVESATLAANERLSFIEGRGFRLFDSEGREKTASTLLATNKSTASQAFTTTDAYVTGSNVRLDGLGTPTIGLMYDCSFDMAKTAGTGAMVVTVRYVCPVEGCGLAHSREEHDRLTTTGAPQAA